MTDPSSLIQEIELAPDALARRATELRFVLVAATLLLVALSWPLWIDLAEFPAIPFVRRFPTLRRSWSWLGLALLMASLGLGMLRGVGRIGLSMSICLFVILILGDQLRLQAWVYQYLLMASFLALLPPALALRFCQFTLASVYFHSGLSKLDVSFVNELGPLFLGTLTRVIGHSVSSLTHSQRVSAILLMPLSEIVIAIALLFRSTRRVAYVGLVLIHLSLILILGPWGLGHSTIVLAWNGALIIEEYLLYWPRAPYPFVPQIRTTRGMLAIGMMIAITALPFLERFGLLDSWPAHALYSSHCERTRITIDNFDPTDFPEALRRHYQPTDQPGTRSLDLTGWSREVRGVPPYPQHRYGVGVAQWIGMTFGTMDAGMGKLPKNVVHLVREGRANPWTGARTSIETTGNDAIRSIGDRYWLNARPRIISSQP
jgi:hypothetical protein